MENWKKLKMSRNDVLLKLTWISRHSRIDCSCFIPSVELVILVKPTSLLIREKRHFLEFSALIKAGGYFNSDPYVVDINYAKVIP